MSGFFRLSFVPATVFCAVCYGVLTYGWIEAVVTGAAVFPAILARRFSVDNMGQTIVGLFVGAAAYLLVFVFFKPGHSQHLGELYLVGKMGALWCIGMVAFRLYIRNPIARETGTAMLLMTAWLFLGLGRQGMRYLVLMPVGFGLVLLAVKWEQKHRNGVPTSNGQWGGGVLVAAITVLISAFFILFIPRAHAAVVKRFMDSLGIRETGFRPLLELGTVREMLVSKKIVMRVFMTRGEIRHLRGAVYNTYRKRYWRNSVPLQYERVHEAATRPSNAQKIEIRPVEDLERFFLPLQVTHILTSQIVRRDQLGVFTPADGKPVERYRAGISKTPADLFAPTPEDVEVPSAMGSAISTLARQWVSDAMTDEQKVLRLVQRLHQNYSYSLTFERSDKEDALIDFLFRNKKGHCAYFASAFALLARSVGIPTRVVGGYYLSEYNPMGGYYIVRDQHAHTWTECWVNGSWRTVDATPPGNRAAPSSTASLWLDTVWVYVSEAAASVLKVNKWFFLVIVIGLLALWIGVRFLQTKKRQLTVEEPLVYGTPHQLFVSLQHTLEKTLPRQKNESIEKWAARLALEAPQLGGTKELLLEYAAWRYGGQGSVGEMNQRFLAWKKSNQA